MTTKPGELLPFPEKVFVCGPTVSMPNGCVIRMCVSGPVDCSMDGPFEIYTRATPHSLTEPPAFDWSTAKAGMAFRPSFRSGFEPSPGWARLYFLCSTPRENEVLMTRDGSLRATEGSFSTFFKADLVRAPEHDVEVSQ